MLGQPLSMLIPQVVGFRLTGALREGATATDLVLMVTQMLRKKKVVGKFVEFYGPGVAALRSPTARPSPTWRPSTAPPSASSPWTTRRSPTCASPAGRRRSSRSSRRTARSRASSARRARRIRSSATRSSSTSPVEPSLAGPKRPQDRVALADVKSTYGKELAALAPKDPSAIATVGQPRHDLQPPPRLGRDRGHHVVHQHVEPGRAPRGRPAGEEGGRAGPHGAPLGQDLARPRLQGGDRVPARQRPAPLPGGARLPRRRLRLHHLHRQLGARCPRRSPTRSATRISSSAPCSPATATSRGASTRRCG